MEIFKYKKPLSLMSKSKRFGLLSVTVLIFALGLIIGKGFNYGIDFAGGTLIQVQYEGDAPIKEVRKALEMGAVDTLLLSDALRQYKIDVICPSCGYSGKMIVKDLENIKCPKCSSPLNIKEKHDIIEEYSEMAKQTSTKVEIISRETEEGETLLKAFGGIAGILRYRID